MSISPGVAIAAATPTFRLGSTFYPSTAAGVGAVAVDVIALAGKATPWVAGISTAYQVGRLIVDAVKSDGSIFPVEFAPAAKPPTQTMSGWTYDANGFPVPPASIPANSRWAFDNQFFDDAESAAQAYVSAHYPLWTYQSYSISNTPIGRVVNAVVTCCGGGTSQNLGSIAVEDFSCPTGYTKSGSACNLSIPEEVKYPPDGMARVQVKPDGSGFQQDFRDPDQLPLDLPLPNIVSVLNTANNLETKLTVAPRTGGGISLQTEQQSIGTDGQTQTYRQLANFDNTGRVVETIASSRPGSIVTTTETTPTNFPTDYNRETTQLIVKDTLLDIKNGVGVVQPTPNTALETAITKLEEVPGQITSTSTGESPVSPVSILNPFTPAACQTIGYNFKGHQVTYDICPWVSKIQAILGAALYLLTGSILFSMFTRRPTGD